MGMTLDELVKFMEQGAPEAMIIMRASELRNFAETVRSRDILPRIYNKDANSKAVLNMSMQRRALIMLRAVWPDIKISALARVIGVSRAYLNKLAAGGYEPEANVALSEVIPPEECADVIESIAGQREE